MGVDSLQFGDRREGLAASVVLNNGVRMPWLGLGVHRMGDDGTTEGNVAAALELGYRHIDAAAFYGNEGGVGAAVRASGLAREEIFVTTKMWNSDQREGRQRDAFEASLARLGLDYVDLYLVHWPVAGVFLDTWKVLEALYAEGRVRAIGVSNFMVPHLEELLAVAEVPPTANQIEFHPYLASPELRRFCRGHSIALTAWSPFMQAGPILRDPALTAIAGRHGKSPAQIILRWDLQHGVGAIPKSSCPARMAENAAIFDFELSAQEMTAIDALDRNERSGSDPFTFRF